MRQHRLGLSPRAYALEVHRPWVSRILLRRRAIPNSLPLLILQPLLAYVSVVVGNPLGCISETVVSVAMLQENMLGFFLDIIAHLIVHGMCVFYRARTWAPSFGRAKIDSKTANITNAAPCVPCRRYTNPPATSILIFS